MYLHLTLNVVQHNVQLSGKFTDTLVDVHKVYLRWHQELQGVEF